MKLSSLAVVASAATGSTLAQSVSESADPDPSNTIFAWVGMLLCVIGSGMFSGLTIGIFSLSREALVLGKRMGDQQAAAVLALRSDSNLLLCTLLWSNVVVNTLLAQLSGKVLSGDSATMALVVLLVPTALITMFGEILPAAVFSRHALRIGAACAPIVRFVRVCVFVVAKPSAMLLDKFVGPEALQLHSEKQLREWLKMHGETDGTDISMMESRVAIRALDLDDKPLSEFGNVIDPDSIVRHPGNTRLAGSELQAFLDAVDKSGRPWVILTSKKGKPLKLIDADSMLRHARSNGSTLDIAPFCYQPILADSRDSKLGDLVSRLKVDPEHPEDHVIDRDVILYWNGQKRIITGADILAELLRGSVARKSLVTA